MKVYLLLKSEGQFKHSGKYYLLNGHWHLVGPKQQAPKGAPIAAHPHAAGSHAPVKHFQDHEWEQLKLPDSNVNAGTYNKQLEQLKQHSEAGHVTGIVGSGFGSNTYGKKLAHIANHLLEKHGSPHKVTAGQKAGEHPAVQHAPANAPEHVESQAPVKQTDLKEAAEKVEKPEPKAAEPEGPKEGDTKEGADGTLVFHNGHWHKQEQGKPEEKPKAQHDVTGGHALPATPDYAEGKEANGVADYYMKQTAKVLELAKQGKVAELEQMQHDGLTPKADGKVGNTFKGKTQNSKKFLAMFVEAKKYAEAIAGGATHQEPAETPKAPEAKPEPAAPVAEQKPAADSASLSKIDWDKIKYPEALKDGSPNKQGIQANKKIAKIKQLAEAGDIAALEAMTFGSNTYAKLPKLAAMTAIAALKEAPAAKPAEAEAKKPEPAKPVSELHSIMTEKFNKWAEQGKHSDIQTVLDSGSVDDMPEVKELGEKLVSQAKMANEIPDTTKLAEAFKNAKANEEPKKDPEPSSAYKSPTAEAFVQLAEHLTNHSLDSSLSKISDYITDHDYHPAAYKDVLDALYAVGHKDFADKFKNSTTVKSKLAEYTQSQSKPTAKEPEVPNVNADWMTAVKDIQRAMKAGNIQEIEDHIWATDDSKSAGGKAVNQYAKDALAFVKAGGKPEEPTQSVSTNNTPPVGHEFETYGGNKYKATENGWQTSDGEEFKYGKPKAAALTLAAGFDLPDNWNPNNSDVVAETAASMAAAIEPKLKGEKVLSKVYPSGMVDGPKEGDIKTINGVQYQLINGRWHKVSQDEKAAEQPKAAEPEATTSQHPIDAVPEPDFSGSNLYGIDSVKQGIKNLKQAIKDQGPSALNGIAKKIKGKMHIKLTKDNGYTVKVVGYEHLPEKVGAKVYDYVMALKEAAGKPKKKPAAKKGEAKAKVAGVVGDDGHESMDSWEQIGGQMGSNAGGKFKDQNGDEWYCKWTDDEKVTRSEVLAAKLYALAGVAGQDCKIVSKGGKLAIASKWVNVKKGSPEQLAAAEGTLSGFAVDAWLANWDVIGLGYDNLQLDADGKAVRIDAGGSLTYRAQGGKKEFGETVPELDSLLDHKTNSQAASVFQGITKADITASVAKIADISDEMINFLVHSTAGGTDEEKDQLAKTLIARKKYLIDKFPDAARKEPEEAPVFRIPHAPDFLNWNGAGQGLSSKAAFNQQNQHLADKLHELGKAGDVDAVKNMVYQPINENGDAVGAEKSIMAHNSKHIPAYANDVIHAMTNPYVSSKKLFAAAKKNMGAAFKLMGEAFKSCGKLSKAKATIGRYAVLGNVTEQLNPLKNWAHKKLSAKNKTIDNQELYNKSMENFKKLPKLQQQAVKDYTGNGFKSMNTALIKGSNHDMANQAIEGVDKASVPLPAGMILSRKFDFMKDLDGSESMSNHHAALQKLLDAGVGTVLEEYGIISTATTTGTWSGICHLKLTCGEGVKGLYVANDPSHNGGAISIHAHENEVILPYKTKFLITKITKKGESYTDEHGNWSSTSDGVIIEATILPNI